MRSKPTAVLARLMRELKLCGRTEEIEVITLLRNQAVSLLKSNRELHRENILLREKVKQLEGVGK